MPKVKLFAESVSCSSSETAKDAGRELRYTRCMSSSRSFLLFLVIISVVLLPITTFASMSSANYQVPWDEWSSGGGEAGVSVSYEISDALGGIGVGIGSSASYTQLSGYRLGDARALSFAAAMAPVAGTSRAYSIFSLGARTVTLTDANPFSVGDYVALVENPGLGQRTAVGRVASVGTTTVTFDRLEGETGMLSASPASARAVLLSGGNISFGEISVSTGAIATGILSVQAPTPAGYTLFAQSTASLASTGHTFTPVSDGVVSVAAEEYGVRTLGTTAALLSDMPLTTAPMSVQSSSSASGPTDDRTAFLYKLALSSTTPAGAYSQSVFFTLTANY